MAANLDDLEALRRREAAAAAYETSRISLSMKDVAHNYDDVYAPLQDDSRFLMNTLVTLLSEVRYRCFTVVEVCCGAAPNATLMARLLPESVVFACDVSVSALEAARSVVDGSHASVHLSRMALLSAFRPHSVDLVIALPPYVASTRMTAADAAAVAVAGGTSSCLADAEWVFLGGAEGTDVVECLVRDDLCRVLSPTGFALVCVGIDHDAQKIGAVVERASNGQLAASVESENAEDRCIVYRIERTS